MKYFLDTDMVSDIDTNFDNIKLALLRLGIDRELVERCASMEYILATLNHESIRVKEGKIVFEDGSLTIAPDGNIEIIRGEDITTTKYDSATDIVTIESRDITTTVNSFGAIDSVVMTDEELENIGSAKRIILEDGTPYVQVGVTELNYHLDDGNPELSAGISNDYPYDKYCARYPRLEKWYYARWGKNFDKKKLEADVNKEVAILEEEYQNKLREEEDYTIVD